RGYADPHPRGGQAGIRRAWTGRRAGRPHRGQRRAQQAHAGLPRRQQGNTRMLYSHVGNKEHLYLEVLEGAYEKIRAEERGLDLEHLDPPKAIERLIDFTWNYFLRNPEFLALLNTENLAKARHLKRSTRVK